MSTNDTNKSFVWAKHQFRQTLYSQLSQVQSSLGNPASQLDFHYVTEIDSTNEWAKNHLQQTNQKKPFHLFMAEYQTNGKGQQGKSWVCQPKSGLLFSITLQLSPKELPGLSLWMGLMIAEALEKQFDKPVEPIYLKWPNDLYWQEKKLGGILVESQTHTNDSDLLDIIIGIGINLSSSLLHTAIYLDKKIIYNQTRNSVDKSIEAPDQILSSIMQRFWSELPYFKQHGFSAYQKAFNQRLLWVNQWVGIYQEDQLIQQGRCLSVDKTGALCLLINTGNITKQISIYSGSPRLLAS
jgi:BirA family biotin operon repressor/biotin-[acetyl-CoA-carboxylase] ligase